MKKILYYSFCFLIMSLFSGVAFAQKATSETTTPEVTTAPEVTTTATPDVDRSESKNFSVQFGVNGIFLKHRESTLDVEAAMAYEPPEEESTNSEDLNINQEVMDQFMSRDKKYGTHLGLDLVFSIMTNYLRINPGVNFILPVGGINHKVVDYEDEDEDVSVFMKQTKFSGIMFTPKIGYRIKFSAVELSPFVGVDIGKHYGEVDFKIHTPRTNESEILLDDDFEFTVKISQLVVAPNFGVNLYVLPYSTFSFITGLEVGYNLAQDESDADYDVDGNALVSAAFSSNKEARKLLGRYTLPSVNGFYFKISLGAGFNF